MSTFGRATFSAAGYAAARPTYPASLYRTVLSYHGNAPKNLALDLGCGHGVAAREMATRLDRVVGIDASNGMIEQAKTMTSEASVTYCLGGAETLPSFANSSVDMVMAGQSAHWFDYSRAWPELARVVKPGGSLAFWGYKDNVLLGHARANRIMDRFCYSDDEVAPGMCGMGRFWEQPGRGRLRRLMREVKPPTDDWGDVRRIEHDVGFDETAEAAAAAASDGVSNKDEIEGAWMRKRINLGELEAYIRTFSAFRGWRDAYPRVKSRAERGESTSGGDEKEAGDIADVLMDRIVASEPQWEAMGDDWREAQVETVWGTYVLLARRR